MDEEIDAKSIFDNLSSDDSYAVDGKQIYVNSYEAVENGRINIEHDSLLFALPMVESIQAITNNPMTRAEAAKAIYRFINLLDIIKTQGIIKE